MIKTQYKFIYISFIFPPLGGAEARYNLSVIRRLHSKGFRPTIITAPLNYPYPKDEYLRSLVPSDIKIVNSQFPYKYKTCIDALRRLTGIPENPLVFKGWNDLYKTAKAESVKDNYDFIYSVHGIGSAHLAALELKEKTGLPWIAEFRDPWVNNVIAWDYMKDISFDWWYSYQLKKTEKLLKEIIGKADLVIVESPLHKEYLEHYFGANRDRIFALGMGYEEEYFSDIKPLPFEFTCRPVIGFVGSIYYGYEYAIKNLVNCLKQLEDEGVQFTLVSVGDSSVAFSKYAGDVGLRNFVPISRVDYSTALSLTNSMDFGLVVVSKGYNENINSKLWECLRLNLNVLAIVPEEGAMAKIIDETRCGHLIPYDAEPMYAKLCVVLKSYKKADRSPVDSDLLRRFSRESMVDEMTKNIRKIVCDRA